MENNMSPVFIDFVSTMFYLAAGIVTLLTASSIVAFAFWCFSKVLCLFDD